MPAKLLYCVSQKDTDNPYIFHLTGKRVYSFEEALYHVYNYWMESLEDFTSPAFVSWVKNTLGEKYLASKIDELKSADNVSERLLAFLSLTGYYDRTQLAVLRAELEKWEKQLAWERLKEMGDYLMRRSEPDKAYFYYKKALDYGENVKVLNNMGICLMHLEIFDEAADCLGRAYAACKEDFIILTNYCEALILNKDFEMAFKYLRKAEKAGETSIVEYLYGKLCHESGNFNEAVNYYKKAASIEYNSQYYYSLSKAYVKLRKYSEALKTLESVKEKNAEFYLNQSGVHAAFTDYGAAVKSLERAIVFGGMENCGVWTVLARYHRLNYDLQKAEGAVIKALNIDSSNKNALLERAKIKKVQGKTRDYQTGLNSILTSFKTEYRNITDI